MERDDRMMQVEVCSRDLGTDVTAEFTLPDYRPEIKRLLRVKAVPLPVDKYVGGNAVELSGAVEFQALYAAADGTLWCVTQREDYRASCPLDTQRPRRRTGVAYLVETEVGGELAPPPELRVDEHGEHARQEEGPPRPVARHALRTDDVRHQVRRVARERASHHRDA